MSTPRISLVVATSANNAIGLNGELPWHLPADLRQFKQVTMGKPIVMGRRTWDSIGRPLPGRLNIVITRQRAFQADGAVVVSSPAAALKAAGDVDEIAIIGGAEIYELFLPKASRIYLTLVDCHVDGDTFFAIPKTGVWHKKSEQRHASDDKNAHDYTFMIFDRAA